VIWIVRSKGGGGKDSEVGGLDPPVLHSAGPVSFHASPSVYH